MARYRRFIRRSFKKRNSERVIRAGTSIVLGNTQQIAYTWTAVEACTVKSIKLDMGVSTGAGSVLPYVLVRVPEGYDANSIVYPAVNTDLYNPTDLVLISGILTDPAVEDHKWNLIGRKMKAGDRLALIVFNAAVSGGADVSFEMSFSILT